MSKYEEVREELLGDTRDFSELNAPNAVVQSFAICTYNLRMIKQLIETEEEYAKHIEDRHKFQHKLVHRAVNSFRSTYILLSHNCYNSCYRELRHQYETYLTLKGVNTDDSERVARKWREFRVQLDALVGGTDEFPFFGFKYIDYLRSRRASGKDTLENEYKSYGEMYGYLSERAAHPFRIDGSYLDGKYNEPQMGENVYFSLFILFGVLKEYERALQDTPVPELLEEEFEMTAEQANSVFPYEVPVFLHEYL
ncbi:DUF5677 domain-containing protein [Natronobeatus ordinarius]|uniref:DUF5677 domain-containing protein n=1 Tax=Natronobeatus ordinarius TaxID=2963433 RepID=UPI0020CD5593|nr:DUF5677 domain-containing protein [Natronobeatus ordinarius]